MRVRLVRLDGAAWRRSVRTLTHDDVAEVDDEVALEPACNDHLTHRRRVRETKRPRRRGAVSDAESRGPIGSGWRATIPARPVLLLADAGDPLRTR